MTRRWTKELARFPALFARRSGGLPRYVLATSVTSRRVSDYLQSPMPVPHHYELPGDRQVCRHRIE